MASAPGRRGGARGQPAGRARAVPRSHVVDVESACRAHPSNAQVTTALAQAARTLAQAERGQFTGLVTLRGVASDGWEEERQPPLDGTAPIAEPQFVPPELFFPRGQRGPDVQVRLLADCACPACGMQLEVNFVEQLP